MLMRSTLFREKLRAYFTEIDMLSIGKLNHKITFQKRTPELDELGQEHLDSFTDYKTVWATIHPLRGKEYWDARRVRADEIFKITIRYVPWVTEDMRIRYKNRFYNITSVADADIRGEFLEIYATEYANTHRE